MKVIQELQSQDLQGFSEISSQIIRDFYTQKLPHALLIYGKKGCGKSNFAKLIAKNLLINNIKNNNSINHNHNNNYDISFNLNQISSILHPDLLLIEKEDGKNEIQIEQIRNLKNFVNQTPNIAICKFIIIDSACELNKNAANSLLKTLEEPQNNNFFILIVHNISRILPTIKSRCRLLKAPNFSSKEFLQLLNCRNLNISREEQDFLSNICDNSIANAVNNGNDYKNFYCKLLDVIINSKINSELIEIANNKNFDFSIVNIVFSFLTKRFIQYLSAKSSGAEFDSYFEEIIAFTILEKNLNIEKILLIYDNIIQQISKVQSLHLDKKLSLINACNYLIL